MQGRTSSPLPEPASCPGCWGRLRRGASRLTGQRVIATIACSHARAKPLLTAIRGHLIPFSRMHERLKRDRPSGVLDLRAGRDTFASARYRAAPEVAELAEHYWTVHWHVPGPEPYVQHTLSNA